MMQYYESMLESYVGKITVAKKKIVLNPHGAPPIHSASYRAGSEH